MQHINGLPLLGKKICLVSSGHVGSNPRLVKEADALHSRGAEVVVIALDVTQKSHVQERDHAVIKEAGWSCKRVRIPRGIGRLARAGARRLARRVYAMGIRPGFLTDLAYNPDIFWLMGAANDVGADLYIAHNLAALPAACHAARKHGARLGFDAEDFHSGELPATAENALVTRLVRDIEQRYLPRCDYLTAASTGIAKAYVDAYGVQEPTVILNVFPKAEAPAASTTKGTACPSPSLYWFSQTIGPDRGLETVVEAIALSRSSPTLFLRGNPSHGYQQQLTALAKKHGVSDRLRFLSPALPSEMVRLAAEYDVGIASEPGHTQNNDLALSNKLFTYMLAGIPTIASATTAQSEMAIGMTDVVVIYPQQDAQALSAEMDKLLLSSHVLANARQAAWQLGQAQFNWDVEQTGLLNVVENVLAC